jgi:transcription elongation GreA/GreB family factor
MANSIQVGSKVQLEIDGKVNEFLIIASGDPATYREGTITADSQIGQALMGRAVGEAAEIIIEGTPRTYKIVAIE